MHCIKCKVWYFQLESIEREFFSVMALNLSSAVYETHERLPLNQLTVVTTGIVAKSLQLYSRGGALALDVVIPERYFRFRDTDPANCLTFVQAGHACPHTIRGVPHVTSRLSFSNQKESLRAFVSARNLASNLARSTP